MITKRCLCAGLLSMALLLSACTPEEKPPEPPKLITLKLLTNGQFDMAPWTHAFQDTHPGVRVETVLMATWMEAGGGSVNLAEKMKEESIDVAPVYGPDLFQPLDPFIRKSGLDLVAFGPWLDQWRHQGSLYALPTAAMPAVMLYNKAVLAQVGLPEPTPDWTWEQFREMAARASQGEGDQRTWGLDAFFPETAVKAWVQSRTGRPWWEADQQTLREALEFFRTMVELDRSAPPPEAIDWKSGRIHFDAPTFFVRGKAAFHVGTAGIIHIRLEQMKPVGLVTYPTMPGRKPAFLIDPEPYGVTAYSKHPDQAWEFLRFLAGPEGARISAKQLILPTYLDESVEHAWFDRQPQPPADTRILFRADRFLNDDVLQGALQQATNQVMSGSATVDQALTEFWPIRETALRAKK